MPPPVRGRRRRRRSPPELVFGFLPEGRRREEAFYRSLDGNAEIEDLLERDRLAEEQRIADLRRQRDMEQQRTDALSREQSARNWADYVEAGARQIALEAVGRHAFATLIFTTSSSSGFPAWKPKLRWTTPALKGPTRASNAPYRTSGKSEARRRTPVPAFSVYRRWRPASSS